MRLQRLSITSALLLLFILIVAACCPIPVPRESIKWPGCEFTITDEVGQPLEDCILTLYFWSYPHRRYEDELVFRSDPEGKIVVAEERFDEKVLPLMMHGVPEYHWSYHIYKEGYVTVGGGIIYVDKGEVIPIEITMCEGESALIESYDDFVFHIIGLPYSEDGRTQGPAEIEPLSEEPPEEPIETTE